MIDTIMQLNFNYAVSAQEYSGAVEPMADQFAAHPGLRWKIWMINEDESEAGGIYLFDGPDHVQSILDSELASTVIGHPALWDFSAKTFQVMEELTTITRRLVHGTA